MEPGWPRRRGAIWLVSCSGLVLCIAGAVEPARLPLGLLAETLAGALIVTARWFRHVPGASWTFWFATRKVGWSLVPPLAVAALVAPVDPVLAGVATVAVGVSVGWLGGALKQYVFRRRWATRQAAMTTIPAPDASVGEILAFGRSTYRGDLRHGSDELHWLAARSAALWTASHAVPDSTDIVRATLYAEAMRAEGLDDESPSDPAVDTDYLRALITRLRVRAPSGLLTPDHDGPAMRFRSWISGVRVGGASRSSGTPRR